MSGGDDVIMSVEGERLLKEELDQLIKVEREEVKTAIAEARALGDLKENAEYHAAKEKQSLIEGRVLDIQSKLNRAKVVDISKISTEKIVFGATVALYDHEKEESFTYQIVGDDESKSSDNKISYRSPLGKALIGLEVGETVLVKAPKGDLEYEIEDVSYR
ncbi:MAG: transcription elongation factor GreA [Bacteriovoracales bacterium]|nr:transcription elongation factor GreA [Bacteriovoracales bacterium]